MSNTTNIISDWSMAYNSVLLLLLLVL